MSGDLPLIISVDDHVVEPPTLWTDRLPAKYQDRAPRVVRDRAKFDMLTKLAGESGASPAWPSLPGAWTRSA